MKIKLEYSLQATQPIKPIQPIQSIQLKEANPQ